ncbi:MAG TPA: homogentisate 1,2-dioxygenase, partial [Phycicoccus sp.]
MAHYQAIGSIPPKRHTQHRRPAGRGRGKLGELYYEELMGEEGFSSD